MYQFIEIVHKIINWYMKNVKNCLSVLYKHIIQVKNKNVGLKVWGGGGQTYHCPPPIKKVGGTCPPLPPSPPPPPPPPASYASDNKPSQEC